MEEEGKDSVRLGPTVDSGRKLTIIAITSKQYLTEATMDLRQIFIVIALLFYRSPLPILYTAFPIDDQHRRNDGQRQPKAGPKALVFG